MRKDLTEARASGDRQKITAANKTANERIKQMRKNLPYAKEFTTQFRDVQAKINLTKKNPTQEKSTPGNDLTKGADKGRDGAQKNPPSSQDRSAREQPKGNDRGEDKGQGGVRQDGPTRLIAPSGNAQVDDRQKTAAPKAVDTVAATATRSIAAERIQPAAKAETEKVTPKYADQIKDGQLRTEFTKLQGRPDLEQPDKTMIGDPKFSRNDTAQMVKDPQVKTINGFDRARFEKIYDRAYSAALARGAAPENAQEAGKDRLSHVMGKLELRQDRAEVTAKPTTQGMQAHVARDLKFYDKRVADLGAQSAREGHAYKGPPARTTESRKIEAISRPRELRARADVESNRKKLGWSENHYQGEKSRVEGLLAKFRGDTTAKVTGKSQDKSEGKGQSKSGTGRSLSRGNGE